MRKHLFTCGESVLLVGEGNFSFSVGLVNLNLSLKITTSCFESEVQLVTAQENIQYLQQKGVRVLLGVDATKLGQHNSLANETFSKIVFNFPHVGGKMKIHLNRELLRGFCTSVTPLLAERGQVLISLCKGQGGTGADRPLRRWDDTWQIVDMAAHGDLVLTAVDPFVCDVFPDYTSVGYRSKDTAFHTDGALVHVFSKKEPIYSVIELDTVIKKLDLETLETNFGTISCCHIHTNMYKNSVLEREGSPSHTILTFLRDWLCAQKTCFSLKTISDMDIPLHREDPEGQNSCTVGNQATPCVLRCSLLDVLDRVFSLFDDSTDVVLFSGLVFSSLLEDFASPPVSSQVLLLGTGVCDQFLEYCKTGLHTLKRTDIGVMVQSYDTDLDLTRPELPCTDVEVNIKTGYVMSCASGCDVVVAQGLSVKGCDGNVVEGCLIQLDTMARALFGLQDWRQLWAEGTCVVAEEEGAVVRLASLYPPVFAFDVCMTVNPPHTERELCSILWQVAGDIIVKKELIDVYDSPIGWSTKCYRFTYQSHNAPLFRKRAINIHHDVVGKALCYKLGVTIS